MSAGEGRLLGSHPENGREVRLKRGIYGPYVEVTADVAEKPQRASVPKTAEAASFSLEDALDLLKWPKVTFFGRVFETANQAAYLGEWVCLP